MGRRRASTVDFAPSVGTPDIPPTGRPRSVIYETAFGGKKQITFDYLVDASGRAGLMSTKYATLTIPSNVRSQHDYPQVLEE